MTPKPKKLSGGPVVLFLTNQRTMQVHRVLWNTGETFQEACRNAGLPALMVIEDETLRTADKLN
jgi:hypothetical protein